MYCRTTYIFNDLLRLPKILFCIIYDQCVSEVTANSSNIAMYFETTYIRICTPCKVQRFLGTKIRRDYAIKYQWEMTLYYPRISLHQTLIELNCQRDFAKNRSMVIFCGQKLLALVIAGNKIQGMCFMMVYINDVLYQKYISYNF